MVWPRDQTHFEGIKRYFLPPWVFLPKYPCVGGWFSSVPRTEILGGEHQASSSTLQLSPPGTVFGLHEGFHPVGERVDPCSLIYPPALLLFPGHPGCWGDHCHFSFHAISATSAHETFGPEAEAHIYLLNLGKEPALNNGGGEGEEKAGFSELSGSLTGRTLRQNMSHRRRQQEQTRVQTSQRTVSPRSPGTDFEKGDICYSSWPSFWQVALKQLCNLERSLGTSENSGFWEVAKGGRK